MVLADDNRCNHPTNIMNLTKSTQIEFLYLSL